MVTFILESDIFGGVCAGVTETSYQSPPPLCIDFKFPVGNVVFLLSEQPQIGFESSNSMKAMAAEEAAPLSLKDSSEANDSFLCHL